MPESKDGRGPWLWVALGCGGLALMGLCLVPPIAILLMGLPSGWDTLSESPSDPAVSPTSPPPPGSEPAPGFMQPEPPPTGTTSPRHVTAVVERAQGLSNVTAGSTCEFDVERHDRGDGTFWCRAQVRCAGELLYGGPNAGYFDCTLYEEPHRHVVGQDANTTGVDSDAAMRLNTLRNELEVRDDESGRLGAFELGARVTDVR